MTLMISRLYTQPGVSFTISHKVIRCIRETLLNRVMKPCGLDARDPEVGLSLMISTKRDCRRVEAKGPDLDKENNCLTWGLWLPYEEIVQNPNQNEPFIRKFFEAAGHVFSTYGVNAEILDEAKAEVMKAIVGNDSYSSSGNDIEPPDLSGIKL